MRNRDFQENFDRENIYIPRNAAARNRTIVRYKIFAQRCEQLKLHAMAAHVFRKLIQLDPKYRKQYLGHYIYNAREAGCQGMSLLLTQPHN